MKYVSLAVLLGLVSSQVFALGEGALSQDSEQGVRFVKEQNPDKVKLTAADSTHNKKEFTEAEKKKIIFIKKNSNDESLNLSSSLEEGPKLETYHVDVKKVGDIIEKKQKYVEVEKNARDEKIVKKVVKCGGGGTKHQNKCQSYNRNFCEALISKQQKINELNDETSRNQPNKISEIETLYSQNEATSIDQAIGAKLREFASDSSNKDKTDVDLKDEIKRKLAETPVASHPIPNNDKAKKFKEDLAECRILISSFKPGPNSAPNSESRAASSSQQ